MNLEDAGEEGGKVAAEASSSSIAFMTQSRFSLTPTYSMDRSGPSPMAWEAYEAYLTSKWHLLLDSEHHRDERKYQHFLEEHPVMLGAILAGSGHHFPHRTVLFSQPILTGLKEKRPDFMWIANTSASITAVLIEIEAPSKRWSTSSGGVHSDLTRARDQLLSWKSWFANPTNVNAFIETYEISRDALRCTTFEQHYVLVHGRRHEARASSAFARMRAHLESDDETLMTWDRIHPTPNAKWFPSVRLDCSGSDPKLVVQHVPPTFVLGPVFAEDWRRLYGREDAILRNPLISNARKQFIIERLRYWDAWDIADKGSVVHTGDRE